jgi:hypothetical protein
LDDVVKFPSRVRPLTEEEAREAIRRAGAVESITALAALLGWERTRAQRTLARWERDGAIMLKPGGPGGRTVIEYVRTPAHQPAGPDAHPTAHHTQVAAHPNVSPDAHPAQVDTQPDAHPARRTSDPVGAEQVDAHRDAHPAQRASGWFRWASSNSVTEWCQIVFGLMVGASSIALFVASVFLNAAFWPGLAQGDGARPILAVFGFVVETCNFIIPSAVTLVQMSSSLRRRLSVLLVLTMATAAIAGASFVRSNLGSAEVSRDQTIKERNRLQGIVSTPLKPVSDASVVAARESRDTAKGIAKSDCPRNKSLDLEVCSRSNAALVKAEAAFVLASQKHDDDVKEAEQRHRKDVADAQAALKDLPATSNDKNVVLAGVAAILPWASEAAVNGIVAGLWVALLLIGPCLLLRLGMALLVPTRN